MAGDAAIMMKVLQCRERQFSLAWQIWTISETNVQEDYMANCEWEGVHKNSPNDFYTWYLGDKTSPRICRASHAAADTQVHGEKGRHKSNTERRIQSEKENTHSVWWKLESGCICVAVQLISIRCNSSNSHLRLSYFGNSPGSTLALILSLQMLVDFQDSCANTLEEA